ncbi:MAG: bifunctional adenosylcobinamide kinase/adenosylcobinamide-phosphate guanylyltransferase [Lachnospiraceae bacterium]|nr:bifunctional adenosylcobinamide kinase/adenosylcobinamide-phosphate guanylyltransferase [Lachnospiraceae bacterium]
MMILVVGRSNCGKSALAEDLIIRMSEQDKRVYLATMVPYGDDGARRVKRHRALREGKNFVTVECARDIKNSVDADGYISGIKAAEATVLLECAANLCANVMFADECNLDRPIDLQCVTDDVVNDILSLRDRVKDIVVVSDEYEEEENFDAQTVCYIKALSYINRRLKSMADKTYDMTDGSIKVTEKSSKEIDKESDIHKE